LRENMKAINHGLKLLSILAIFFSGPALADGAVEVAPAAAAPAPEAPAATTVEAAQASANPPNSPALPGEAGSAAPTTLPAMQPMPYFQGLAGRVMFMPIWMQTMPGMPPVLSWVPVMLVPAPAFTGVSLPQGRSVDYGPLSEAPVIELPAPEEVDPQPSGESGATIVPGSEKDMSATSVAPSEAVSGEVSVLADAPWTEPTVDYGPVTDTPVVDLLALEKKLLLPAVRTKERVGSSAPPPAKPVPAPKKARMCWKNGIVAPCK
jgi:hypothetical protein